MPIPTITMPKKTKDGLAELKLAEDKVPAAEEWLRHSGLPYERDGRRFRAEYGLLADASAHAHDPQPLPTPPVTVTMAPIMVVVDAVQTISRN